MKSEIKFTQISSEEIYTAICLASQNGTYVSYIRGKRCKTEVDCIHEISASFQFPFYFGENWNAVDECLTDLEWLDPKSILVIVDDFSQIFCGNKELQQLLIKRWIFMVEYWTREYVPITILLNY